jgi:hypothetical protein
MFFRKQKLIYQLQAELDYFKNYLNRRREDYRVKAKFNFPVGTKILVVPNSPCPELIVGEVIDHIPLTQSNQLFVVYRNIKTGVEEFTGNASYWNQDLEDLIRDLPWWKRWNIVHPMKPYTQAEAEHLEKHGTLANFESGDSDDELYL